jgi:hypothetical protein
MTRGDDVAQSPSLTEPKWGQLAPPPWPDGQVLVPIQFPLCQRVKVGRWMGYPCPKLVEAELGGWLATCTVGGQGFVSYRLKSMVELTHSTYKYSPYPLRRDRD